MNERRSGRQSNRRRSLFRVLQSAHAGAKVVDGVRAVLRQRHDVVVMLVRARAVGAAVEVALGVRVPQVHAAEVLAPVSVFPSLAGAVVRAPVLCPCGRPSSPHLRQTRQAGRCIARHILGRADDVRQPRWAPSCSGPPAGTRRTCHTKAATRMAPRRSSLRYTRGPASLVSRRRAPCSRAAGRQHSLQRYALPRGLSRLGLKASTGRRRLHLLHDNITRCPLAGGRRGARAGPSGGRRGRSRACRTPASGARGAPGR
jgi:hypothetical protein